MYNKSNRITTSCLVLSHRRWSELYRWDDPLLGHSISRLDRRVTLRRSNSQAKQLGQQPELAGSQKISAVSNSALICEGSLFARTATIALPSFTGGRGTESFGQFPVLQHKYLSELLGWPDPPTNRSFTVSYCSAGKYWKQTFIFQEAIICPSTLPAVLLDSFMQNKE